MGKRPFKSRQQSKPNHAAATANTLCESAFGSFTLQRRPRRKNEVLQAWDNADLYLLNRLQELQPSVDNRILLVNDSFGALALALADYQCVSWGDSAVSQLATQENAEENQLSLPSFLAMTERPKAGFDFILYRLPRSHSLMRYQLQALQGLCKCPERVLIGGMAKYITAATVEMCSQNLGVASTSLAWKKARLIQLSEFISASIEEDRQRAEFPEIGLTLINRANVFSRGKLDQGSRLLLSILPELEAPLNPPQAVADLGCGNGLLGISAAKQWPQADIHFFDDSFMAIDSARENCALNGILTDHRQLNFSVDDCMSDYRGLGFDLVLCNPPFHQEQQMGDHIAKQMFAHAKQHLRSDGKLCVVGNRHLGYHLQLKRHFSKVTQLAANAKFVVLLAEK
ncbi:methyltransferase [Spongiibacter sp. KMU-158]|uniref:Methyltransferase n=1 Tax=Spongiibacter pelagi TaxID=2760804 RepID=A0A927C5R3_9GAMM|nr:methyltransferase [Spongiibacter pelagi]MBD2859900.1 methyltransferase [Spongiibacter pelagi]